MAEPEGSERIVVAIAADHAAGGADRACRAVRTLAQRTNDMPDRPAFAGLRGVAKSKARGWGHDVNSFEARAAPVLVQYINRFRWLQTEGEPHGSYAKNASARLTSAMVRLFFAQKCLDHEQNVKGFDVSLFRFAVW